MPYLRKRGMGIGEVMGPFPTSGLMDREGLPVEPEGFTTYTDEGLPVEPPGFTTYGARSGGTFPKPVTTSVTTFVNANAGKIAIAAGAFFLLMAVKR